MPLTAQAQSEKGSGTPGRDQFIQSSSKRLQNLYAKCLRPVRDRNRPRRQRLRAWQTREVSNTNKPFIDPLADKSVSAPSALAEIKGGNKRHTSRSSRARRATRHDWRRRSKSLRAVGKSALCDLTRYAGTQVTTLPAFNLVPGFPKQGNVVWQGFGGRCQSDNDGDPIVQYDQLADRWILTQFAVSATPYTQCVAVSTSPDPTGTYFRYAFSYSRTSTIIRRWAFGLMRTTSPTTCSATAPASW
jgi:hypothetical protein